MTQQALDRATGVIPDLESYIALRRDTSGCKPCWALIECKFFPLASAHRLILMKRLCLDAENLDIPDEVMEHPLICNLGEAANDLVTWSNVSVGPYFPIKHHSK